MSCIPRIFLFSLFLVFVSSNVNADVCDLSGSGIGGTGAPALIDEGGSGIGGTGAPLSKSNGSGIGGTGVIANDSGIGGTGQKADRQTSIIIGTITGFGSICVNGIEIHLTRSTPIQINGEVTDTEQLAIGQVVSVTVSGSGNEVVAQDIQIMNIVAGPIAEIDPDSNRVTVLGQQVLISGTTKFTTESSGITNLHKGDFIRVSGLRQVNGAIAASRIVPSLLSNTVQLSGTATNITTSGFKIEGMNIHTHGQPTIKENQQVIISGQIDAGKIILSQLKTPTITDNQHLRIEGFVNINTAGGVIKVGHVTVETTEQMKDILTTVSPQQKVIVDGIMSNEQAIKIDHLFIKENIDRFDSHPIHREIHKDTSNTKIQNNANLEHSENVDGQKNETEQLNNIKNLVIEQGNTETKLPVITPTRITPIAVETIKTEPPGFTKPEVDTSRIELPETEVSEIKVPEVEALEMETTEVETPEVEVHEVETPEIEEPEINTPTVEASEIEVPEIEIP